ncbi:copper resistance protein CopC [Streptomyces albus]|uniref:copper resistance protein CopC n=1 Tax=Streptomyces albus TaxID=1888 RepID=UPI00068E3C7F|nr:copper resistance protein CopC [Streptomyces albus]
MTRPVRAVTPSSAITPAGTRSRARRLSALLVLVGTVLAVLLGGAGPASAHAALRSADPAGDTVLETAPRHVTLTFTEKVSLTNRTIRVISPSNTQVAKGDPRHVGNDGTAIRIGLRDGLAHGTYTVAWHVVSADSHPASGAFTFSIGEPSGTAAVIPSDTAGNKTTERLYGLARYGAYAGLALLVGGCAFALLCLPRRPVPRPLRRLVAAGWSALVLSTVALILLRGPYQNGDGPLRALDLSALPATFGTRPGTALLIRLLLLAVAGACLALPAAGFRGGTARTAARTSGDGSARPDLAPDGAADGTVEHAADGPPRNRRPSAPVLVTAALLTAGLAATWVTVEHASVGPQAPLAITVAGLHLVAMAVWAGGLAALSATVLRRGAGSPAGGGQDTGDARAAGRFSTVAFVSVCVLVLTGLVQSWRQVGAWDLLLTTFFGKLLLTKAVVVLLLLVVAAASRRLTARLRRPAAPATAPVPLSSRKPEPVSEHEPEQDAEQGAEPARVSERRPEPVAVGAGAGAGAASAGSGEPPSPPAGPTRGDGGPGNSTPANAARTDGTADDGPEDEGTEGAGTEGKGTEGEGTPDKTAANAGTGSPVPHGSPVSPLSAPGDVPPSPGGDGPVREGLRRSVIAELAIGAAILAVTVVLTGTQPARAVLDASQEIAARGAAVAVVDVPLSGGAEAGEPGVETVANVTVDPARVGTNRVQVLVLANGGLVGVPEVRVSFTLEEKGIGPLEARLEDAGGYWLNDDVQLPLPGEWTMAVTVRTSEFDQVTKKTTVEVRPAPGTAPEGGTG